MSSTNLSWFFNVEYYKDAFKDGFAFSDINQKFLNFNPIAITHPVLPGELSFDLQTQYPGLLAGTGYCHQGGIQGEVCAGLSLDYVTGSPYLPGSSVKGALRAAFEHEGYIRELLQDDSADVLALECNIFGHRREKETGSAGCSQDVFLDAYPVQYDTNGLLDLENITPHHVSENWELSDPIPLTFLKIRPDVVFRFRFLLADSMGLVAEEKLALFRKILLDLGIGAKTNVGFGRFTDGIKQLQPVQRASQEGVCLDCGKKTKMNAKTGKYYSRCFDCNQKHIKMKG